MIETTDTSPKGLCLVDLRKRVLVLDLCPGVEVEEQVVATRYGLSRTPAREVFQTLAGAGYLQLARNRGARVSPLGVESLSQIFQLAPVLLATAARLAAGKGDEGLEPALDRVVSAGDSDWQEVALAEHALQRRITDQADNAYLSPAMERMMVDLTRLIGPLYDSPDLKLRDRLLRAQEKHAEQVAAIIAGKPEPAARAALGRWELLRDDILYSLQPEPLPDTQPGRYPYDAA
ncbi:GntR family transcriptional regulator [Allosediminivita pacifica]|uniref:GntR family transcriptional regulator n=1 Tax=Allosediminivita pacifica TaxID=1267769 RepID=A0A2T6B3Q9_9RHOB|nr:GntR family transcriptional regulator [Allosediminivita pacifica]PTX50718.1 GntR family transcriptional regulator [Allosediminivita pacifica]GGB00650.1 GntR family transcriptional regulator [Allosediminivita pacifica]